MFENNYFKNFLLSSGVGEGANSLTSFDSALLKSGVANYNLVKVSSILPAHCLEKEQVDLPEGSPLYTAYASISSNVIGETIAACVGVGIPEDVNNVGVIMEFSVIGTRETAETNVIEMIKEAMNNRGYKIKEIITRAADVTIKKEQYMTVFTGLSMW